MSDLYALIQQLCSAHNITIAFLERECGLGNGTIKKWGTAAPSSDRLKKVADFFNVSVDYLLINKHGISIRQGHKQLPFSRNLTRIREGKNLSIEDVSQQTSFTPDELSAFEKGTLIPDEEAVNEIASALNVTFEQLEENDFISKDLKETELLEWIQKRNEKKAYFNNLRFWDSFTDHFDESMPEELLLQYHESQKKMELEFRKLKDELIEVLQTLPLWKVMNAYEYYLDQKILALSEATKDKK